MKKKIGILVAVQLILLIGFGIFAATKERTSLNPEMDSWQSQKAVYDETQNSWYVDADSNAGESNDTSDKEDQSTICGPYIDLKKGSYTVTVAYETDTDHTCTFAADGETGRNSGLEYSDVKLNSLQKSVDIEIEARENVKNFEVRFQYGGSGYLKIDQISIKENRYRNLRHLTCLFFLFLLLDGCIVFWEKIKQNRKEILVLLGIAFFSSLPLMMLNLYNGHDLPYHLLRIEGIAQELKLGHFPVRMHSYSCSGYGHPVSIYYGDLLLYIPAVLRLLGFSVLGVYKIYIYMINLATVLITYWCLKQIYQKKMVAMAGAAAYTLGAYRIVDIFVRASLGEFTAMLVFPVIALAVYQMYTADETDWKEYRKNIGLLVLGMTGLITSHILSTEMVTLFLAFVAIVLIKKTIRKNTLKVWIFSVIGTLLVNAWFLVPFVNYYLKTDAWINHRLEEGASLKIQAEGAYIGQYFAFLQSPRGLSQEYVATRLQLTPGLVFMAVLLIAVYMLVIGKRNKKITFYTGFALFSLFLASDLFPWDWLVKNVPGFRLLASVQFPWRYITIAVVFLMLLLCELLVWFQETETFRLQQWCSGILAVSLGMACILTSQLFDTGTEYASIDGGYTDEFCAASLNRNFVGDEYLRKDSYTAWMDGQYRTENMNEMTELSRKGEQIRLHCETGEQEGAVEVPMFHYPGYHAWDDQGKEYKITDGFNNTIRITLPAEYSGDITIDFWEPVLWRVSEVISLLSVLFLAGMKIIEKKKEK
ncbi:MAG: hypothetical protein ACI4HI_02670 [Lachnospiraceae bacterium]